MRFPSDTFPNAVAPVDPTDPAASAAVTPARRVGDGTRGIAVQVGGRGAIEEEAGNAYFERAENDRRKMCRRIYHIPVLLDTRSGEDRRRDARRTGEPLDHIAREV